MSSILSIAKKELKAYFGSPMAAIFIGAFLVSALFSFFWLETFFSRNIADIRPLFRWMPLLMIFLSAALTMRQWSEEQKMGTLEILLTLPVRVSHLVIGKFLAVLALVAVALALTVGLPITVSMLGDIDWGPVLGGYVGSLLMASAYIAIGLFFSSRTDNQIIALMLTVLLSCTFYLLGSAGITTFMGNEAGEFFRSFGTGSRFQSIERGVLDLRDVLYYCSLTTFFLMLNTVSVKRKRWSEGQSTARRRHQVKIAVVLVGANLLALNIWLNTVHSLRLDLTERREYSISQPTRDLIANLREPLVLRGYFSEKTHPLLAPLVPRIRDFMEEYKVVSNGNVNVSFVDPKYNEDLEAEANQQYGIKPVPFQVAGRYETAVVNSYLNILVKYGDQFVTLGFDDLIEIRQRKDGQLDVGLRNLEYDLTKSIKKVVYGFQSMANAFESINKNIELSLVVTPGTMPGFLAELPKKIEEVARELVKESRGKMKFTILNPDDPGAGMSRDDINRKFGVEPIVAASLFSSETFYLYLFLTIDETTERLYLSGDMGSAEIRQEIEAVLKRASSGFLKTVGLWVPDLVPPQMAMMPPQGQQFTVMKNVLQENYNVEEVDLSSGHVPGNVDVLLLLGPQKMSDLERLAIDQYLMQGGSVVAAAGNYFLDISPGTQSLTVNKVSDGISELLEGYGVTVEASLVMDKQNEPFPVPVMRDLGGFMVREIRRLDYPFFVDIRREGMNTESPIVANLPAVTMNWTSPLLLDKQKTEQLKTMILLRSSPNSWLGTNAEVQPDFERFPENGFPTPEEFDSYPLAVTLQGSFTSFYADKPDPRFAEKTAEQDGKEQAGDISEETIGGLPGKDKKEKDRSASAEEKDKSALEPIIKKSSDSSRLVVLGSSEFISDTMGSISQPIGQERFLNSLELLQNIIDWTVEEEELLAIRSRGAHARLLYPLSRGQQSFWEWLNYAAAIIALVFVSWYGARRRHREEPLILTGHQ